MHFRGKDVYVTIAVTSHNVQQITRQMHHQKKIITLQIQPELSGPTPPSLTPSCHSPPPCPPDKRTLCCTLHGWAGTPGGRQPRDKGISPNPHSIFFFLIFFFKTQNSEVRTSRVCKISLSQHLTCIKFVQIILGQRRNKDGLCHGSYLGQSRFAP